MKKHLCRYNLFIILAMVNTGAFAQELLTLDKAIETALKNNYGIIVARNEARIAENNNSPGNAGFLPSLDLSAAAAKSDNTIKQQYADGREVNQSNVTSTSLSAGATLTWTLFDGMKMFATSGKLKTLADQGELNTKIEIENTIYAIMSSYYDVVRIKQLIRAGAESLKVYEEREKITQTKFDIGSGSKQELLQTKVDKSSLQTSLLFAEQALYEAKANLNLLLAQPPETAFYVDDSMTISDQYKKEDLVKTVVNRNYSLLFIEKNIHVAGYSVQEYQSLRYPRLGINAGYDFIKNENKAGFSLFNQTSGLSAGVGLTWNIFDGFNTNRQIKNTKLVYTSAVQQYEYAKNSLNVILLNAWRKFENAKEILALEEENIMLAKENMDIALERFKLGASTIIELKEAQNSYEESSVQVITARYNARLAEVQLMKLNGDLVK